MTAPRMLAWLKNTNLVGAAATTRPVGIENSALRLLGTGYLLADSRQPAPGAPWRQIYPAASTTLPAEDATVIYENATALPRAWLVPSASYQPLDYARLGNPAFDPRTLLMVEAKAPELKVPDAPFLNLTQRPTAPRGRPVISWVEDSPERIRINVKNGSGGWLVLGDPIAAGWEVRLAFYVRAAGKKPAHTIDREVLLVPAYGLLRAAPLVDSASYGERDVQDVIFEFNPRPWRRAWMVSAGGLVLLLILAGWGLFPLFPLFPSLKRP